MYVYIQLCNNGFTNGMRCSVGVGMGVAAALEEGAVTVGLVERGVLGLEVGWLWAIGVHAFMSA